MALTTSLRKEGVSASGKRTVTLLCTFSDGSAVTISPIALGLKTLDAVHVVPDSARTVTSSTTLPISGTTTLNLDPDAAGALTIVFYGS